MTDACQRLAAYGDAVGAPLPVQIRLHARPLEIVERVLERCTDAYRAPHELSTLATLLGVDDDAAGDARGAVRLAVARAALRAADAPAAFALAEVMSLVHALLCLIVFDAVVDA